jgi:hypothetical protein
MFKKILAGAVLLLSTYSAQLFAAPINTDIVFVVDESGSMSNVQTNLRNNIGLFASILTGTGQVDARYALVGYGSSSISPRTLTDFTTAANFATAAQGLLINGGTEPGYAATAYALNQIDGQTAFSYRANAVKNIIILTDEPSNGDNRVQAGRVGGQIVTESLLDGILTAQSALYNGVLSGGSTINSYSDLITDHGGQVFSLSAFNTNNQTVIEQFVTDFANAKLQETLEFCDLNPNAPECQPGSVPEPGTLFLFGLGLVGLAGRRKLAA